MVSRHAAAPVGVWADAAAIRASGLIRSIAATAGFNVCSSAATALAGALLARTLGPTLRGDYAALTAWFSILLLVGGMGQPAALCYYVAHQPRRARGYVATSRAMVAVTGSLTLIGGMFLAPTLCHGDENLIFCYRVIFAGSIIGFVGAGYTYALQARDQNSWNIIRTSQPVLAFAVAFGLWAWHKLDLDTAVLALIATMLSQFLWAYHRCHRARMAPGHARRDLIRPLAAYGMAQMASLAPYTLNASLDQLVLSQLVPAADLGRYVIAVSVTSLPLPVVAAIGNIAFPRLAARNVVGKNDRRLLKIAVVGSAAISASILAPIAIAAGWLVPLIFGVRYAGAVPLLWLLAPGGVFFACGQVTGDLLRGRKQLSVVARSQWLAAVATVALLCILLPTIGVAGAAIASTVAYGIALAAMARALWKGLSKSDG
jgi:O-antigen/teichoic acid export membrane protein